MLYVLLYLNSVTDVPTVPTFETKDYILKNYILGLSSTLLSLGKKGLLAQAPPLDFPVHLHQPGDYVLGVVVVSLHTSKEGAPPNQKENCLCSHIGNIKVTLKRL
jgi:hypothetical protein